MKHFIKFSRASIFFLQVAGILQIFFLLPFEGKAQINNKKQNKTSIIVITDLYHPYQDPGDNFDLIMPYALPELDLKAIILDVTDAFRKPVADHPICAIIEWAKRGRNHTNKTLTNNRSTFF